MIAHTLRIAFALIFASSAAVAGSLDFDGFKPKGGNLPNSYKRMKSVEGVEAKYVHSFSISGGKCRVKNYNDGSGKGDCNYGSVRSELREKKRGVGFQSAFPQPDPAWYGFDLLIPQSYPTKGQQVAGFNIFAQWKSEICPHMAVAHWTRPNHENALFLYVSRNIGSRDNHDCGEVATRKIVNMNSIKGRWARIELFIDWSSGKDGLVEVYVNDKLHLTYRGPNLEPNNVGDNGRLSNKNYFSFGSYLANTGAQQNIKPGTVYFANVKRAVRREELTE